MAIPPSFLPSFLLLFQHHNESVSLPFINELLSALDGWTDSSYGNDCCASISNGEIQIFLPNSLEDNEATEETSYFQLFDENSGESMEFDSVEEVISFVNSSLFVAMFSRAI